MGEEQKKVIKRKINKIKQSNIGEKAKEKMIKSIKKTGMAVGKGAVYGSGKVTVDLTKKVSSKVDQIATKNIDGYNEIKGMASGAKKAYKAGKTVGKAISSSGLAGIGKLTTKTAGKLAVGLIPGVGPTLAIASTIAGGINLAGKAVKGPGKAVVKSAKAYDNAIKKTGDALYNGSRKGAKGLAEVAKKSKEIAPKMLTTEGAKEIKDSVKNAAKDKAKKVVESAKDTATEKLNQTKDKLNKPFEPVEKFNAQMREAKLKDEGILPKDITLFPEDDDESGIKEQILQMEKEKRNELKEKEDRELEKWKKNNKVGSDYQRKEDAIERAEEKVIEKGEKAYERRQKRKESRDKKIKTFNGKFPAKLERFISAMVENAQPILEQQSQIGKDDVARKWGRKGRKKMTSIAFNTKVISKEETNKVYKGDRNGIQQNLRRLRGDLYSIVTSIKYDATEKDEGYYAPSVLTREEFETDSNEFLRNKTTIPHLNQLKRDMNSLMHDQNLMSTIGIGEDSSFYDSDQGANGELMLDGLVTYEKRIEAYLKAGQQKVSINEFRKGAENRIKKSKQDAVNKHRRESNKMTRSINNDLQSQLDMFSKDKYINLGTKDDNE